MDRDRPIRVTILDDSRQEHCTQCGSDPAESVEFAIDQLRTRYGDALALEYVDLAQPGMRERFTRFVEMIESHETPLPLVIVNDMATLAGIPDYRMIMEAIETAREVGDG